MKLEVDLVVRTLTMAYRALSLILMVLTAIISTSPSVRTATTTSQRVSCVKDIVTIVGGGVGIVSGGVGIAATLWKLVNDHRSGGENDHVYSDVPRIPSNHLFQPRIEELRELEEKFNTLEKTNPGDVVVTVYITGDPGSGKTQLAGQYGREFIEMKKHMNKNLFAGTLIADSRSNFLDKYLQIAHDLGCITEETEKAIESHQLDELVSLRMLSIRVKKELRKRPGWLLIIDGLSLDEKLVKELHPFWPQPNDRNWGKGYVLVTTQGRAPTGPSIDMLDLRSGMSEKDAIELITKESNCSNEEEAAELVELLDRSPLSIACAGVYIRNERSRKPSYSFKNYQEAVIQEGAQHRVERDELRRGQGPYIHTRKDAISMTAKQMVSNDPNLRKVFVLLAACAQAPVPLSLVARVLGVPIDSRELEDVLNCALLSPPSTGLGNLETVSVHQVTRSVLKDLFLKDTFISAVSKQKNGIIHITDCVCQEYDNVSSNIISSSDSVTSFPMMRLLTPHIESLLQIHSDATCELKLRFMLGESYQHMGKYMEAREVLEKARMVFNEESIKETREGAGIAKELGWIYIQLGMFKESRHILKEALETFTKLYGEESAEVAEVLTRLGGAYFEWSQFQESWKYYERALEIYEKLYGHNHTSVATVLVNLGSLWRMKGENLRNLSEKEEVKAKAISLYRDALAIQEEVLGRNHLSVAATTHILGGLLGGEHGINLLKRALDIRKNISGEDHPEVARTLFVLGDLYYDQGDLQKAKKLVQDALFILRNFNNSPLMASAQGRLGMIHLELEEFEEAQNHFQDSFATHKAVYGVEDKDKEAHRGFAMAARLAGNLQHAKEILETAEDSLSVSDTLRLWELGKVYLDLGYLTKSLQVHSRALDTKKIAFIQADLARALWESGQVRSGLEMMQQALKEYQRSTDTVSENDSVTKPELDYRNTEHVLMLVTMSQMLQDTGNLEEARGHLENALQRLRQSSFPHNLVKAKTIYTYGTLFHKLAAQTTTALNPVAAFLYPWYYRYKARNLLNNALDIMRKVCTNHPNTATILAAIGRLDLDSGDLHSAKHHLKEALDIQTKCCGSIHPNLALYHQLLAEVASQTGDEPSAKSNSQEADKIYETLIKREREN